MAISLFTLTTLVKSYLNPVVRFICTQKHYNWTGVVLHEEGEEEGCCGGGCCGDEKEGECGC